MLENRNTKKLILLGLLMFTILLNQNIFRGMKDSFIVTSMGSEAVSFIRLWFELPFGILFVLLYTKLCNIISTEKIFRYIIVSCLTFFGLFAFFIFPNLDYFHPSQEKIFYYSQLLPVSFHWFIVIWSKWCLAVFYIVADLWPAIVYSLLFWQLANKITSIEESLTYYPILSLIGQSNLLFSGPIIVYFSSNHNFLSKLFSNTSNKSELTIKSFTLLVIISGGLAVLIHGYIERMIIGESKDSSRKIFMTLNIKDSIRMILSSKYLLKVCLLIICYNIVVILIDGLWMNQARKLYPTVKDLMAYQGRVFFFTGIFSLIAALSGAFIIKKYGWFKTALITPLAFIIVGSVFFIAVIANYFFTEYVKFIINPLIFIIFFGALQNVIGKGIKYSLFDSTKEMAYIPLNDELKTKGKAAVDIIGVKVGRFLGAGIEFLLLIIIPGSNYEQISYLLFLGFVIVMIIWIASLISLHKDYNHIVAIKS